MWKEAGRAYTGRSEKVFNLRITVQLLNEKGNPILRFPFSRGRSFCHDSEGKSTVSVEVVRIFCGLRSQVALSIEKSAKVIHKYCTDGILRDVCRDNNKERCNTGRTSCHRNRYGKYL